MINRRQFSTAVAASAISVSLGDRAVAADKSVSPKFQSKNKAEKTPLGFDNFSIRACQWKAGELLDFAAEQQVDSILFSDLDVFENHETEYLKSLAAKAADQGIKIQSGTGGICPTSTRFDDKWGSAERHLKLAIRVAKDLGSNVVRCYLGTAKDRQGEGGIDRHIESTVQVLKSIRDIAIDANVKIAVENHAGDMQAWELASLIEAAGTDFVGATIDSGNAAWTLEHPLNNLEVLGKYALSSGMRDSTVWEFEDGAKVAWNAIGEGQVDWKHYTKRFAELCPGVPFQLEIISGFNKAFEYQKDEFWDVFPNAKAKDFEAFLKMARTGKSVEKADAGNADYQLAELKRSIAYCKNELNLGLE